MVLQSIIWPQARQTDESEDSDDLESETFQVAGLFRRFVEEGKISAWKFGQCFYTIQVNHYMASDEMRWFVFLQDRKFQHLCCVD